MWNGMIRLPRRVDSSDRQRLPGCEWLGISTPAHHGTRTGVSSKMQSRACMFTMLCPGIACTACTAFLCEATILQICMIDCRRALVAHHSWVVVTVRVQIVCQVTVVSNGGAPRRL